MKWSEYQLRTYLDELAKLEYLMPLCGRQGQPFRYGLAWNGQGGEAGQRFLAGIKSVEQLRREAQRLGLAVPEPTSSQKIELRGLKAPLRGEKMNFEGTSLEPSNEVKTASQARKQRVLPGLPDNFEAFSGEHIRRNGERSPTNA